MQLLQGDSGVQNRDFRQSSPVPLQAQDRDPTRGIGAPKQLSNALLEVQPDRAHLGCEWIAGRRSERDPLLYL